MSEPTPPLECTEMDAKCYEFFEAVNSIVEQLQRIADVLEQRLK